MRALIDLLRESRHTVVFTGAGVSTLSGIPDFRGEQGIYRRVDGDLVFDLGVFLRDPGIFYTHGRDLVYGAADHAPSIVHTECARLEAAGKVAGVITQNIDMLHQRAGSRTVVELHGSPARHSCLGCDRRYDFAWARERVARGEIPRCAGCGGVVKPDITFFGELLPDGALERAGDLAAAADLLLVLGSSLVVQPAASIPLITCRCGGRLVIVNHGATPLDRYADLRYDDLASVFARVAAEV
ncbi:MAG TPA: Sir2 family NAD-dependent protein deacetylase [Candidatus Krumholzibacteria bacterium]|nr:Sir2 family NAD-dependent protein deacetylase [Candidatus Krumholzibacteria bacterium]HPD72575.1 Sir2 family NAD-dependent protein deacetylase [Candidatus Krumholzibacteria bacterium]HRY40493.1 Sir2 family NAD-dependent protein deacetylase [Candidatus Krumholzibacteria bacterium]